MATTTAAKKPATKEEGPKKQKVPRPPRTFVVRDNAGKILCLVRAANETKAHLYFAKSLHKVSRATDDDLVKAGKEEVEIHDAIGMKSAESRT